MGSGAGVGVFQNPAGQGGAADLLEGVLAGSLFEILVERAQKPGRAFNDPRLLFIQEGLGDAGAEAG